MQTNGNSETNPFVLHGGKLSDLALSTVPRPVASRSLKGTNGGPDAALHTRVMQTTLVLPAAASS